ncbi:MAG: hypothetical protein ACR2NP_22125 [Pirellulaceae bacterium]
MNSSTSDQTRLDESREIVGWKRLIPALQQIGEWQFLMLTVVVASLVSTILITWPLWELRVYPPNLRLFTWLPPMSMGIVLLLALYGVLLCPRRWFFVWVALLLLAFATDLIRCQPQMVGLTVLMAGCIFERLQDLVRWYLISMWLWAGVHKLLSPYWLGPVSYTVLDRMGFEAGDYYYMYAIIVPVLEIGLALLAWLKPRVAAPACLLLHLGIAAQLVFMQWNYSVGPWNIATGAAGAWLLWRCGEVNGARQMWPQPIWQQVTAALMLIIPAGIYYGVTPQLVAHVLYSDNMPKAVVLRSNQHETISTWESLRVPFPGETWTYSRYFAEVGYQGDVMLVSRVWPGQKTVAYYKDHEEVTRQNSPPIHRRPGDTVGVDFEPSIFALEMAGARMLKRTDGGMVYAVEFPPDQFEASQLRHLSGLPNLEQVQLGYCPVIDDDLRHLDSLQMLTGIGLDHTNVTDAGLRHLQGLKHIELIEHAGTTITPGAVRDLIRTR